MLLVYADETGDSGTVEKRGAALTYGVGCVLIDAAAWPSAFDKLIEFRRELRDGFGVPVRAELKASFLVSGSGPLRGLDLTPAQRQRIYRDHLALLAQIGARAFAVLVDKHHASTLGPFDVVAWQTAMERLERTTTQEKTPFALFHDNGNNDLVRKVARKARRHLMVNSAFGTGPMRLAAAWFVDDPSPRDSAQSYLIQCADLVAYAAFRSYFPPGRAVRQVAPRDLWAELGSAVHSAVNRIGGGTPGIVVRKEKTPRP